MERKNVERIKKLFANLDVLIKRAEQVAYSEREKTKTN